MVGTLIIAHRGASYDAPENTVEAARLAWEQQADAVEFDCHLTADNHIVVHHDNYKNGKIRNQTLAQLALPRLTDMIATSPGKPMFIEVKCGTEILPELVRQVHSPHAVISFNSKVIAGWKKRRPDMPAYWVLVEPVSVERVLKYKADGVDVCAANLTREYVRQCKDAGLRVYTWTVNDVSQAEDLIAMGVDGITTDRPGWLRSTLTSRTPRP